MRVFRALKSWFSRTALQQGRRRHFSQESCRGSRKWFPSGIVAVEELYPAAPQGYEVQAAHRLVAKELPHFSSQEKILAARFVGEWQVICALARISRVKVESMHPKTGEHVAVPTMRLLGLSGERVVDLVRVLDFIEAHAMKDLDS